MSKSRPTLRRRVVRQARSFVRKVKLGALPDIYRKGALVDEGWFESYSTLEAVGPTGEPIPWYTYSAKSFLEPRLTRKLKVFEFGCGNSTLWYAARVARVDAVEHDPGWVERMQVRLPANARVIFQQDEDAYVSEVRARGPYDIIVIDGLYRSRCAEAALESIAPRGVLIWDNSDREEFFDTLSLFTDHGFREVTFSGIGPTSIEPWATSVIYRSRNCLGL